MATKTHASQEVGSSVEGFFKNIEEDLQYVTKKLEVEYLARQRTHHANPLELLQRLRVISQQIPAMRDDCESIRCAKQDLIDSCQSLMTSRTTLQRLSQMVDLDLENAHSRVVSEELVQMTNLWNKTTLNPHTA
ncbi:hypothetical protein PROFUN_02310 [Planoprotostelium fungivorum]|uniref:Protein FAM33A n=1 Tax=Planoprotostelium fungivorum TaxID=1890364 RepID=A0A2P6NYM6_9EUKA|nr:hypothetical protein PROFUN_02310 [Planoprotostelium fungivorum]